MISLPGCNGYIGHMMAMHSRTIRTPLLASRVRSQLTWTQILGESFCS